MNIYCINVSVLILFSVCFTMCNKDCEEPEEPVIEFEPYFVADSVRVWGDFESDYQIDDIELRLTAGDTSSTRLFLGTLEALIYPIGEVAQTSGAAFNGSISIMDRNVDTTIAIVEFESFLEGGDESSQCINPLIRTVTLRQGNRLLHEGPMTRNLSVYLEQ